MVGVLIRICYIFLLTFVHSMIYSFLEVIISVERFHWFSYLGLFLIGLSTFIFFILFYNATSKLLKGVYIHWPFKRFLLVFGALIVFFNILLLYVFIPGLIYLISSIVIYQNMVRSKKW